MLQSHIQFHSSREKRQILVIDDEAVNRELLGFILADNYEVLYAGDGAEGLQIIREHRKTLSLIMLDLLMPEMNGWELLTLVKNEPSLKHIPVIVLTSEKEAEVECLHLGAVDFIKKPYELPEVILARVQRIIELQEDRALIQSTERDDLTGLYTREYFYRYAEQFDQYHSDLATDAIVIDINHFHMVNDRYGKAYGDQLLMQMSQVIRETAQECGGIACRREADTFLIYCPHRTDYKDVLSAVSRKLTQAQSSSSSTVHLRMGGYPDADKALDMDLRFDRAKLAADTVRNNYINNVAVYDRVMHEKELFAESLIECMDQAMEERQFQVYYQPKFNIKEDPPRLSSAEALVRWHHPQYGIVSPALFIPLFEENGLIQKLDDYVWRRAAEQVRSWKETLQLSVPVSVNVSRIDMYDPNLLQTFQEILRENQLDYSEYLLEITESAYTEDSDQMVRTVQELRELGFRVEMDDFGSGYSSLNMLSTLPVDALKLDMHFMQNGQTNPKDMRMLKLMIDIADYLSVPVIAEGVETEEQMRTLKELGCDIVQGYYYSKPLSADDFITFIKKGDLHADN